MNTDLLLRKSPYDFHLVLYQIEKDKKNSPYFEARSYRDLECFHLVGIIVHQSPACGISVHQCSSVVQMFQINWPFPPSCCDHRFNEVRSENSGRRIPRLRDPLRFAGLFTEVEKRIPRLRDPPS
jgi:hypothetical protein